MSVLVVLYLCCISAVTGHQNTRCQASIPGMAGALILFVSGEAYNELRRSEKPDFSVSLSELRRLTEATIASGLHPHGLALVDAAFRSHGTQIIRYRSLQGHSRQTRCGKLTRRHDATDATLRGENDMQNVVELSDKVD